MSRSSVFELGLVLLVSITGVWFLMGAEHPEKKFSLVYNVNGSGYIDVCGCKHKEVRQGSLTRRASFLEQLRATGRQLVLLDGGSSLFPIADRVKDDELPEALRKAELIVEAYNRMGYHAMAIGSFDIAAGLDNLKKLSEKASFEFLSANLLDSESGKPVFKPHIVIEKGNCRVGVIGLTQATMSQFYLDKVAPDVKLEDPVKALKRSMAALEGRVDTFIVLSHLREENNFELLEKVPDVPILVDPFMQYGNHHTWIQEEEWVTYRGSTLFLRADGQGARLGIVDAEILQPGATFLNEDRLMELRELEEQGELSPREKAELAAYDSKNLFRYLRVSLEPHHGTDPEIDRLIAEWKQKADLASVPRETEPLPRKKDYLTVDVCKKCHEPQYKNWLETRHAEAMASLVETEEEILFDCIGCHSLGYGDTYLATEEVGQYANVQCESCHGTNPQHVEDPEKHPFGKVKREDCIWCHNKEVLGTEFSYFREKSKVQCPASH